MKYDLPKLLSLLQGAVGDSSLEAVYLLLKLPNEALPSIRSNGITLEAASDEWKESVRADYAQKASQHVQKDKAEAKFEEWRTRLETVREVLREIKHAQRSTGEHVANAEKSVERRWEIIEGFPSWEAAHAALREDGARERYAPDQQRDVSILQTELERWIRERKRWRELETLKARLQRIEALCEFKVEVQEQALLMDEVGCHENRGAGQSELTINQRRGRALALMEERSFDSSQEMAAAIATELNDPQTSTDSLRTSLLKLKLEDGRTVHCGARRGATDKERKSARNETRRRAGLWWEEYCGKASWRTN